MTFAYRMNSSFMPAFDLRLLQLIKYFLINWVSSASVLFVARRLRNAMFSGIARHSGAGGRFFDEHWLLRERPDLNARIMVPRLGNTLIVKYSVGVTRQLAD